MSHAKAYKFRHNDFSDLEEKALKFLSNMKDAEIYIVTESVFSMDGDIPDLNVFAELCDIYENVHLVVDEAHAIGVFKGGLIQELNLLDKTFARIITFGKALGCHGAAILGSKSLKEYLVNFSRSLIYTTALSPHSVATIRAAYEVLIGDVNKSMNLHQNIQYFREQVKVFELESFFIESTSAIHCCVISGNEKVKTIAGNINTQGFNVKPILSPTVPENKERLRFCIHSFNTKKDIKKILEVLSKQIIK